MTYDEKRYWENRYRNKGTSGEGLRHERAFLVERVTKAIRRFDIETILDVGVGTGELATAILATSPHVQYEAFDISPTAVARAKRRLPNIQISVRDMVEGPCAQRDLSLCFNVHYHMATADRARRLVCNVLDSTRKAAMFLTWNQRILERGPLADHCHFWPFELDAREGFTASSAVLPSSPHKTLYVLTRD